MLFTVPLLWHMGCIRAFACAAVSRLAPGALWPCGPAVCAGAGAGGHAALWHMNSFCWAALRRHGAVYRRYLMAVGAHWLWNVVWGPVLGFAAGGLRAPGWAGAVYGGKYGTAGAGGRAAPP